MNNRISGDFGTDALEAFRAAYAQREVKPEDLEVDRYTGLPTGEITNISPWIQHTGLWKANPGTDRTFVPNQLLEVEEEFDDEEISEEDFEKMVDEVLSDLEEEERFADEIYNGGDDEEDEDSEDLEDEELEALIDSLLAESEEGEDELEEDEDELELPSDEELDSLIEEIMAEIDEEEAAEEAEASRNREFTNDELEGMIDDLTQGEREDGEEGADLVEESEELDEEELSGEEIDRLVDEILGDIEDEDEVVVDQE